MHLRVPLTSLIDLFGHMSQARLAMPLLCAVFGPLQQRNDVSKSTLPSYSREHKSPQILTSCFVHLCGSLMHATSLFHSSSSLNLNIKNVLQRRSISNKLLAGQQCCISESETRSSSLLQEVDLRVTLCTESETESTDSQTRSSSLLQEAHNKQRSIVSVTRRQSSTTSNAVY